MTDLERSVHAQISHMGTHQREAMVRLARGAKVNKQTIASLTSRGWIHVDDDEITITPEGTVALRLITQEAP